MRATRTVVLGLVSLALTWWILHWRPGSDSTEEKPALPAQAAPVLELLTRWIESPETPPSPPSPPVSPGTSDPPPMVDEEEPAPPEEEPLRPPREAGVPDGDKTETAPPPEPRDLDRETSDEVRELMSSESFLEKARQELEGQAGKGFQTAFRCRPEDQLSLARFFGEKIVLIPRSAIDPDNRSPRYYQLDPGPPARIDTIAAAPPLERFRQYRDLFDFEYSRLPAEVRDLRRKVLARSDIYLFAALIPLREWALVAARRDQALDEARSASSSRPAGDGAVRRFTLSYRPLLHGEYDIRVEEILFADDETYRPGT